MDANALRHPWIPVVGPGGEDVVSIHELLERGHEFDDLSGSMYPLQREALLRLLTSVAAVGLRGLDDEKVDEYGDTGIYPLGALKGVVEFEDRFRLRHPTMPFLQEWSVAPNPEDGVTPLAELDPHVPGSSSSQWGVRAHERSPGEADVLLGLTVLWFHSKWSNKGAPTRMFNSVKGAPGYGGSKDLTVHWIGKNLGLTLAAGIATDWVDAEDPPAWLDQDFHPTPAEFATSPESLWRTTYTPNRPVLHWDEERPVGFVIGCVAGKTRPVPGMPRGEAAEASDPIKAPESVKAAVGVVHERDVARCYRGVSKPGEPPQMGKVAPKTHRLLSTEGAMEWFKGDFGKALQDWGDSDRVAQATHQGQEWQLGCYLEECDGTGGTRRRSSWVVLDSALLTLSGPGADEVLVVMQFIDKVRHETGVQISAAAEGSTEAKAPVVSRARAALCFALDGLVLDMLDEAASTGSVTVRDRATKVVEIAEQTFREQTAPLRNPATIPQVELARATFSQRARTRLHKV